MRVRAEFVVETGADTAVFGMSLGIPQECAGDLRYWDWMFQSLSKQMSREIIRNTAMTAHLVTHPDDMPISCDDGV